MERLRIYGPMSPDVATDQSVSTGVWAGTEGVWRFLRLQSWPLLPQRHDAQALEHTALQPQLVIGC